MPKNSDIFIIIPFEKLKNSKAWKITSELVRRKSNGLCYTCGRIYEFEKLHCGHFREKRGGSATYFDLRNLKAQCYACNVKLHGNKQEYATKLVREYGAGILDELARIGSSSKQWTKYELDVIAEERKKELDKLKMEE